MWTPVAPLRILGKILAILSEPHRTYIWEKEQQMRLRTASSILFVYLRHRRTEIQPEEKWEIPSSWAHGLTTLYFLKLFLLNFIEPCSFNHFSISVLALGEGRTGCGLWNSKGCPGSGESEAYWSQSSKTWTGGPWGAVDRRSWLIDGPVKAFLLGQPWECRKWLVQAEPGFRVHLT